MGGKFYRIRYSTKVEGGESNTYTYEYVFSSKKEAIEEIEGLKNDKEFLKKIGDEKIEKFWISEFRI